MNLKIKEEYLKKRLAFGKSANPLYKRDENELVDLAIMAIQSKDTSLLKLFDGKLPALIDLKKSKTDRQLKEIVAAKK